MACWTPTYVSKSSYTTIHLSKRDLKRRSGMCPKLLVTSGCVFVPLLKKNTNTTKKCSLWLSAHLKFKYISKITWKDIYVSKDSQKQKHVCSTNSKICKEAHHVLCLSAYLKIKYISKKDLGRNMCPKAFKDRSMYGYQRFYVLSSFLLASKSNTSLKGFWRKHVSKTLKKNSMLISTTQKTDTSAPAPYVLSASLPILKSNLSPKWAQKSDMCRIALKTAHVHSKPFLRYTMFLWLHAQDQKPIKPNFMSVY